MAKKVLKKKTIRQKKPVQAEKHETIDAGSSSRGQELERIPKTIELKDSRPSGMAKYLIAGVIVAILLGSVLLFSGLLQQNSANQQDQNASSQQQSAGRKELTLTILSSKDCISCNTTEVLTALKTLFPGTKEVSVDLDSNEGKKLYESFKPVSLPAFIYSKEITFEGNYLKLQPFLAQVNGAYLLNPLSTDPAYFIEAPSGIAARNVKGDENALVTVIEFSDFQCPYCKEFFDETYSQLLSEFKGKILLVFRHYPLDIHAGALPAAVASECAADQNRFWDYHGQLFGNQQEWTVIGSSALVGYADRIGLDVNAFKSCFENDIPAKKALIQKDIDLANKFGVSYVGTPAFLINNHLISGSQPIEVFRKVIGFELARLAKSS
ncbi:DsbA family protein [archaeon]|nr:DsbA family protein [archaeon]